MILESLFYIISSVIFVDKYFSNAYVPRVLDYAEIVYREQWGADETMLLQNHKKYIKKSKYKSQYELQQEKIMKKRIEYIQKNNSGDYFIQKEIKHISGNKLNWSREYFFSKKKIIIHHTAMPHKDLYTDDDINKHLLYIQELHSFYRGWGDIGYHFFVGPNGKIYEGKAGGEGIIGAHAQFNNYDSIGISLLGNFEYEEPTREQILSLILLISSLSQKYNISLLDDIVYHKRVDFEPYIEDVFGVSLGYHKMIYHTECPGENVLKYIPIIKDFISQNNYLFGNKHHPLKDIKDIVYVDYELPISLNLSEDQHQDFIYKYNNHILEPLENFKKGNYYYDDIHISRHILIFYYYYLQLFR